MALLFATPKTGITVSPAIAIPGTIAVAGWCCLAWRSHTEGGALVGMLVANTLAWGTLAWAALRAAPRDSTAILIFGVIFRLVALAAIPVMEDDYHRFLWDGYRFAATGNPYAEVPQAYFTDNTIPVEFHAVLDGINHPDVPTIYGPFTEWAFRLAYGIAPARLWPWKLILLGAELALFAMLWPVLKVRGRLLLSWCPLAVFETGFNAHPDALAIALLVAAWWWGRKSQPLAAGVAAGLAVAAKIFAAPLVPFLLWRQGWRAWALAAAAVLFLYAPFWLHGSTADLAGLRAMAGEWEFNSSVFAVVSGLATRHAAQAGCALAFGCIWCALFARWTKSRQPSHAMPPGDSVYGAFLLLSATANPWYCLWLWPFVAARLSAAGMCALAAVSLTYVTGLNLGSGTLGNFEHPGWLRPLEFSLIALGAMWDRRQNKTRP